MLGDAKEIDRNFFGFVEIHHDMPSNHELSEGFRDSTICPESMPPYYWGRCIRNVGAGKFQFYGTLAYKVDVFR